SGNTVKTSSFEFPVMAKYRFRAPLSPFVEAGPSFRPAGNGSNLSHAGFTAGAGFELHAGKVNIAPTLRYTRWKDIGLTSFQSAVPDQLELLVGVYQRASDVRPELFGRRLSVGVVAGVGLGDDIRAIPGPLVRRPDSNTAIVGAMVEAHVWG